MQRVIRRGLHLLAESTVHLPLKVLGLCMGPIIELRYVVAQRKLRRTIVRTSTVAVAVHLFYVDSWSMFARGLDNLRAIPFDLFVTLPSRNRTSIGSIRDDFPAANVMVVPNHGRGTLPFIKVAQLLADRGYEVVLKLHCKKSPASQDARSFLGVVLECLLPTYRPCLDEIISCLSSPDTAILGPSEVYLPLDVSLPANESRLSTILSKLTDPTTAQEVLAKPASHGFFAGSMFWTRLDAIHPLLQFSASDFEYERGQVDGTLAHALERAFTLWPQLQGRRVLQSDGKTVDTRAPESTNEPWWLRTPKFQGQGLPST